MSQNEEKSERARKIAKSKLDFFRHLITYIIVMVVLAIINNVTDSGYQWWLWPALGWGVAIVSHFVNVFIFTSGNLEKKLTEKEMEKMDEKQ